MGDPDHGDRMSPDDTLVRERTITWSDPMETAAGARGRSGLEFVRAVKDGELPPPPIAVLMNMGPTEVDEGRVVFEGTPGEEHYNPIGVVHAGFVLTLMDSALGCAVQTTLPAGTGYTTLETKGNMIRPIHTATGRVLAEAVVLHSGRTTATAEVKVTAAETGKLLAHGSTTCAVIPMPES
jgi:uncharacterized protein (TIGR00369 family)